MSKRIRITAALCIILVAGFAAWAVLGPLHSGTTSAQAATPFTVTLTAPHAVAANETADLSGSVSPRSPGASVDLQVKTGHSWRNVASAQLTRASTYVLAFSQINPGFYSVRVFKPASPTRAPGSASATQIVTGSQVKLRPGTIALTPAQLLSFSTNAANDSTLVLAASAQTVAPGNHLVMSAVPLAPNGVLATVTSVVRNPDGTQLVHGVPASLSDAYATFNVSVQNGLAVAAPATQASGAPATATLESAHLDAAQGGPNFNLSDLALQCSGPDRPQFSLEANWSAVSVSFLLDIYGPDISFVFDAAPTITVSETFNGNVGCSLPDNEKLKVSFPIWDSPPILLTIKPVLTINATGVVTFGYVFSPFIALGFDRGDGDDYSQETMTLHGAPFVHGNASFSSQLGVSLEISLAGLEGITGTIGPELTGSLAGSCVTVGADLGLDLEANVDVFVKHWDITLWSGHFFPVQIAHFCFTPSPAGPTATPKSSSGGGGSGSTGSSGPGGSSPGGTGDGGSGSSGPGPGGTTGDSSISIAWGTHPAPSGNWMDITFSNFRPGTISWDCVEEGTAYGPYSTTLTASTETLTTNTCYDTAPGGSDYVSAYGLHSNTILADGKTSTPPPPERSISIAWGSNPAPSGNWMDITFTNFPTGPVSWDCVEEGTPYGPYTTTLTSSTETLTTNTCYDTQEGGSDYVTADGVSSNTIPTDASTSTPPPPTPSISVSWGSNPAPAGKWMDITFTNFPTGPVTWYCIEEGQSYGPYSTSLSSSTETLTTNTCYDTEAGGADYVTSDGVNSNTIGTD